MTLHDDALMIYNGNPVTLRDYRRLMEYEPHVTIWAHFCIRIWRWAELKALRARKREASRLMKRIGIQPASWGSNSADSGAE